LRGVVATLRVAAAAAQLDDFVRILSTDRDSVARAHALAGSLERRVELGLSE
jgi:hypothetical protein